MRVSAALLVSAAAGAWAQTSVPDYGSSLNMTIDPGSVDEGTRATWCEAEYNTCQTLCGDDTSTNDCTQADLKYECECSSNSSAPGLQYYTQTMPTFICDTLLSQCIAQNTDSQRAQDECKSKIGDLCGKLDPPEDPVDAEVSSTTASAPTSTTTTSEPSATEENVTTTTSDDFAAPTMAPARGVAAAAALGLFAVLV